MATLMDLPMELLCNILEEVGGSQLRRGSGAAARLCLCRRWYAAAHPVYLSGLGTTDIKIYGHNLDELNTKYGYLGLRQLMYKNTRYLKLRFLGHFWDQNAAATYDSEDEDGNSITSSEAANDAPFDFTLPEHERTMETWRDEKLKPALDSFFDDLTCFSELESVSFEASSDSIPGNQNGPHWDYIHQSTVQCLLHNLPIMHNLSTLTLDICGMRSGLFDEQPDVHLCESLSLIIPQIENVRLRMPSVCPSLFQLPKTRQPQIRLKTLILKMSLPYFAHTIEPSSLACDGGHVLRYNRHRYSRLINQSQVFLRELATLQGQDLSISPGSHGMIGFRISFKDLNGPRFTTVDCLTMRYMFIPGDFFYHEDDGSPCWYELEPGRMQQGVPFR